MALSGLNGVLMRRTIATEAQEQEALITWAEHYEFNLGEGLYERRFKLRDYLLAIPNAAKRTVIGGVMMKRQGLTPGVADLFLALPMGAYAGMWIEMKRRSKQAHLSNLQALFLNVMRGVGYKAIVAYGWDEAREKILEYIKDEAELRF